ncbi:hypothetical protein [Dongshaea marina]|uniref:hypothetical protein n=1 Tax=Dongshaea marina TaxID=2047966 RepID=UPI00131F192E|nr:hypothetical protein [Dongshaea marina]
MKEIKFSIPLQPDSDGDLIESIQGSFKNYLDTVGDNRLTDWMQGSLAKIDSRAISNRGVEVEGMDIDDNNQCFFEIKFEWSIDSTLDSSCTEGVEEGCVYFRVNSGTLDCTLPCT